MSTASLSLRLPKSLIQQLEALASALERPKTYILRKALERYLLEQKDYQIALDRLLDKDDAVLSSQDLRKRLGRSR